MFAVAPYFLLLMQLLLLALPGSASAQDRPAQVVVGTYVNKIQDLNFHDNKYSADFYLWFRWRAEGALADYKPLASFEVINGKVESTSAVVEKKIGELSYASVRVLATMSQRWQLANYPFDAHTIRVDVEDSSFTSDQIEFVADTTNSRLGDELNMSGWKASNFNSGVAVKEYRSNYGDLSLPTDALSRYSRFFFSASLQRTGQGGAVKLLSTVLLATAVAFLAFLVKPSDLDARFGMGVGALFAAAASAIIAASAVPESGATTLADLMHMVAMAAIFGTLLLSALNLKLEVSGREALAFRIDRICLFALPVLFYGWVAWLVWGATH